MIQQIAQQRLNEMINIRRYLHQYPEISFEERKTSQYILNQLKQLEHFEITYPVGQHGIIAKIGQSKPNILFRADFDALPIQDLKDVPYKSKIDGVSHACGHDAHTATLLMFAELLNENVYALTGSVTLLFQYAEEVLPGGAQAMIQDGALKGVDKVYGQHYWSEYDTHLVRTNHSGIIASADFFKITITGKGGHAARPHLSVDPVVVAAETVSDLQTIVSRRLNPIDQAVLSICAIDGGDAFNVIPQSVTLKGTVRTFKQEVKETIMSAIKEEATYIAKKRGATAEVDYNVGYPAVINHYDEAENIITAAQELNLDVEECPPLMIGEDFSYYLQERPGAFFLTGIRNNDKKSNFPHHHPRFDIDEDAMVTGLSLFMKILEIERVIQWK